MELARTLAHHHSQGWVHLKVSPSNVLITKAGKFKLKDYTYSQMVSEEQTIEIAFSNKKYLAPEITNMHLISPKNDIYSLGFVLYELMVVSCQPDTNDFTN